MEVGIVGVVMGVVSLRVVVSALAVALAVVVVTVVLVRVGRGLQVLVRMTSYLLTLGGRSKITEQVQREETTPASRWAKLIRAGAEQTPPVVPDTDGGDGDGPGVFCRGPTLGGTMAVRGAARHTPTEEHAPNHALILLAASLHPVNGEWALRPVAGLTGISTAEEPGMVGSGRVPGMEAGRGCLGRFRRSNKPLFVWCSAGFLHLWAYSPYLPVGGWSLSDDGAGLRRGQGLLDHDAGIMVAHPVNKTDGDQGAWGGAQQALDVQNKGWTCTT
ncbi:hypothetical protein EYF80_011401 [Liparis tanakae]|uniref:Uncharacterized protein n=1 Tax=Liparis tanakae TaxID=230148 RepID=A0A4Z2IL04_9TELE|nr:hypothetical protein EYF80_011401 [Liparis tanakae]